VLEGALHNLPDHNSELSAREILSLATSAMAGDLLVVLVTGGGSALLSLPEDGITIDEKKVAISTLTNAGANIEEVNRVRQCISKTKAGKLGMAAYPAKVVCIASCVCRCVFVDAKHCLQVTITGHNITHYSLASLGFVLQ